MANVKVMAIWLSMYPYHPVQDFAFDTAGGSRRIASLGMTNFISGEWHFTISGKYSSYLGWYFWQTGTRFFALGFASGKGAFRLQQATFSIQSRFYSCKTMAFFISNIDCFVNEQTFYSWTDINIFCHWKMYIHDRQPSCLQMDVIFFVTGNGIFTTDNWVIHEQIRIVCMQERKFPLTPINGKPVVWEH